MREILFRGKRIYSGEWVYGNLVLDRNGEPHIVETAVVYEDGHHVAIDSDTPMFIDPATVGQYTGLTDKNGVKIFEGDIVKAHDTLLRCDEPFHEFSGVIGFANASFMITDDCFTHYRWMDYDIEVIGNVHDSEED